MKLFITAILSCLFCLAGISQSNTPCSAGVITAPAITVSQSCNYQSGTTVGATQSTNAANGGTPSCGSMGPDSWYSFIAPAGGSTRITTEAVTITDGVMSLYSGTCGAFTELACSDDEVGLNPEINTSTLTPGERYLIRYWNYGGGTGTFSICIQNIVSLPLRLLSFNGNSAGASHILSWETADEVNTSHFDIERSTDGIAFSLLSRMPAAGAGNHHYSTTDMNPLPGNNYYRLKSVDLDGQYTYSKIILLQQAVEPGLGISVFPNPSHKQIQVIAGAGNNWRGQISVYNLAGQELLKLIATGYRTNVDISRLVPGTYILQWAGEAGILRTKFLKAE